MYCQSQPVSFYVYFLTFPLVGNEHFQFVVWKMEKIMENIQIMVMVQIMVMEKKMTFIYKNWECPNKIKYKNFGSLHLNVTKMH